MLAPVSSIVVRRSVSRSSGTPRPAWCRVFPFFSHTLSTSCRSLHLHKKEEASGPPDSHAASASSSSSSHHVEDGSATAAAAATPSSSSSIPLTDRYPLDFLGEFQSNWFDSNHPYRIRDEVYPQFRSRAYVPNFSDYMSCTPYEAILEVASTRPYHDVLALIMEHSFFFLIQELGVVLVGASDAPLPHVIYEDVMKVLTFASLQQPPDEQFQLSSSFRFLLLAKAASICMKDSAYLYQARRLFRRMEQQQSLRAEDYSMMVWIYAAAKDLASCSHLLLWMTELSVSFSRSSSTTPTASTTRRLRRRAGERLRGDEEKQREQEEEKEETITTPSSRSTRWAFSPRVFSLLQHPSVDVCALYAGHQPHVVKGLLWQQRLAQAWAGASVSLAPPPPSFFSSSKTKTTMQKEEKEDEDVWPPPSSCFVSFPPLTFPIGVHAVFMHYVITRQTALQWKWLGMALEKERLPISRMSSSLASSTSYSSFFVGEVEREKDGNAFDPSARQMAMGCRTQRVGSVYGAQGSHSYPLFLFGDPSTTTLMTPSSSSSSSFYPFSSMDASAWVQTPLHVSPRTLRIAVDLFLTSQGRGCPAKVVKELFFALLRRGDGWGREGDGKMSRQWEGGTGSSSSSATDPWDCRLSSLLLFLLMRVRRNECMSYVSALASFRRAPLSSTSSSPAPLSFLHFTSEEIEWVCQRLTPPKEPRRRRPPSPTPKSMWTSLEEASHPDLPSTASIKKEKEEMLDASTPLYDAMAVPLIRGLMRSVEENTTSTTGHAFPPMEAARQVGGTPSPTLPSTTTTTTLAHTPSSREMPMSTSSPRTAMEHSMASWKTLLQQCASFGRQVLRAANVKDTKESKWDVTSSTSFLDSSTLVPEIASNPVAFASARLLFRELEYLDKRGLASLAATSSMKGAKEGSVETTPNELVKHRQGGQPSSSEDIQRQIQDALRTLQQQGMTDTQQYFTRKVMEESQQEEAWMQLLQENPTSLWTSL